MEVLRSLAADEFGPLGALKNSSRWDQCQLILSEGLRYLGRDIGPVPREDVFASLEADLRVNATDWDTIKTAADQMRFSVRERVMSHLVSIEGDLVLGDKFENVSGSSIVNRSHIGSALGMLKVAGEERLAIALGEIASHLGEVSASQNEVDIFEDLVRLIVDPESSPGKADHLWQRLVAAQPGISRLSGSTEARARFAQPAAD